MPKLSKPKVTATKVATKKSKKTSAKVIREGTVEPLAGWTVAYQIIEDDTKTTDHNPDGRFVRFGKGINWMPDRAVGAAYAYRAVVEDAFDD
jgi:hypothetical protein